MAQVIRRQPRALVEQSISTILRPASASEAVETYWLMQVMGKSNEGREALRKVAGLGIPLPIQP